MKPLAMTHAQEKVDWPSLLLLWLAATAVIIAPGLVHFDETDSQNYQTLVRHLIDDGAWLNLRYLPKVYPQFREHLPFGFWPYALATRWWGEGAQMAVATLFTAATYPLVAFVAAKRGGARSALLAVVLLGSCESFFLYGSRTLLEPPLLFLTSMSCVPLWLGAPRQRGWAFSSVFAALATLVKGPFGIIPLFAFGGCVCLQTRRWRDFAAWAFAGIFAVLPWGAFLLYDRAYGGGTFWEGYLQGHLLASATGARDEFRHAPLFPFLSVAGRMFPALTVVLAAVGMKRLKPPPGLPRQPTEVSIWILALGTFALLAILCIPIRKNWTHALIAYPPLSVLAALMISPWLEPWGNTLRWRRTVRLGSAFIAWMTVTFALAGGGRWLVPPPCVFSEGALARTLHSLPEQTPIGIVTGGSWAMVSITAAEGHLAAQPFGSTGEWAAVPNVPYALVSEPLFSEGETWREVGRDRGWILLRKIDSDI